jgi:hypothetical protein
MVLLVLGAGVCLLMVAMFLPLITIIEDLVG